ncbi:maf-like protein DDB_G0281937 isoform X2 [Panicum hallii]|uniref:maf-like protein DDB_G0281937 isoform X2 n=1 Tax=Panicum hallii TaxID=206008 RepID=UPI000DF4E31B|nr:maf-like protein DDB_G0281937 isoform X2 [Panicum hallii]
MASISSTTSFPFKIILGSSSPARREILADMGYEFIVMSADIDEKAIRKDKPDELVKALAEAKAEAIKLKLHDDCGPGSDQTTLLITSDQVMVSKGVIRERPRSAEEAREFIKGERFSFLVIVRYVMSERKRHLQGGIDNASSSFLLTGYSDDRAFAVNFVLVSNLSTGATKGGWDIPEIKFKNIPDEFIDRVVNQGEMTCVAGGLKLTHPSVLPFIIKELG